MFVFRLTVRLPSSDLRTVRPSEVKTAYFMKIIIGYSHPLYKGVGKAVPLQYWTGLVVSRRLSLPDFKTLDT